MSKEETVSKLRIRNHDKELYLIGTSTGNITNINVTVDWLNDANNNVIQGQLLSILEWIALDLD